MKTEQRLKELGIELTKPTSPMARSAHCALATSFRSGRFTP